jgi:hypothetical protein
MDERDPSAEEGMRRRVADKMSKRSTLSYQIMDLENRNAALQEELSQSPAKRSASLADWLPRVPAAHVLTGHRSTITRVAFHPQYSLLASASEDTTVKIWDWETGEFERTLKGHTRAVLDVDFDHKGNLLGQCRVAIPGPSRVPTDGRRCSDMFFRSVYQNLGQPERVEEHQDVYGPRSLHLVGALFARGRAYRKRKSG